MLFWGCLYLTPNPDPRVFGGGGGGGGAPAPPASHKRGARAGGRRPASERRPAPWTIALCLFAVVLAAYLANGRVLPSSGDDVPTRLIPFSLLRWGTPTLDPFRAQLLARSVNPFFLLRRGGHLLSLYPPAAAIVALPVYVPSWLWLRAHGHTDALYLFKASVKAGKLAAAVLAAASVAVLFLLLARRVRVGTATILALAFGLASGMWVVSSQLLWQHGPGVLCILLGMACLAACEPPSWRTAGAGFFLGAAAAVRPQNAVFLLAGGVLCAWEPRGCAEKVREEARRRPAGRARVRLDYAIALLWDREDAATITRRFDPTRSDSCRSVA